MSTTSSTCFSSSLTRRQSGTVASIMWAVATPCRCRSRNLQRLCIEETGKTVPIAPIPETSGVDLRIYVTDARKVETDFGWRPTRDSSRIVRDIRAWIEKHHQTLESLLT